MLREKTPWVLLNTKQHTCVAAYQVPYCRPAECSSTMSSNHLPSTPISRVLANLNCCRTPWLSHQWDSFFAPSSVHKRRLISTRPDSSSVALASWNRSQWIRTCLGVSAPCPQGQHGELTPVAGYSGRSSINSTTNVLRLDLLALVSGVSTDISS